MELLFLCLCFVSRHLLDSCICRRCFSRHLPRQMARHLYLSRLTKDLYICSLRSGSHFFDLSRPVHDCSSPKHYLSHSKRFPQWFFKLFQVFLRLVCFYAFHVLKPRFWDFSKLMSYCWNFGIGFAYMILKLHALHHTCIITIFSYI